MKPPDRGFPADYLFSRLAGRRAHLVPDWNALMNEISPLSWVPEGHYLKTFGDRTPEAIWRALLFEYGWVYYRMNPNLRETFSPFFLYAELRTMSICLRYLRQREMVKQILTASMLSDNIKRILGGGYEEAAAVQKLETAFLRLSKRFAGIAKVMRAEGLKGFEQKLAERYLSVIVYSHITPVMKAFFRHLIDARNMHALAKLLRPGTSATGSFIPGGTVRTSHMEEILISRNRQAADRLLRAVTGETISSLDPGGVEIPLYRSVSRRLTRERRAEPGICLVLDYLWRCSIDAINLGVLFYGKTLGRDAVAAELVR